MQEDELIDYAGYDNVSTITTQPDLSEVIS